jgi:uncharacterized protein (TIGR00730 family)
VDLASAGFVLVYGGGATGLMGAVAEAAHISGGCVHGIITHKLANMELARKTCDELEYVDTMRQRKQRMEELADAFVALPGGIGTFEELFEMLVARQLGDHDKPILIVNVNDYFAPFRALLAQALAQKFIDQSTHDIIEVFERPEEAVWRLCEMRDGPAG